MKKILSITTIALIIGMITSCKTTKNTSKNTSSTDLVNYKEELPYAYPLADTAFKYSSSKWEAKELKEAMNENLKGMIENLKGVATMVQYGDALVVSLDKGNVFGLEDYTLNENAKDILRKLAFNLNQNQDTYIMAVGRTDATGSADFNKQLAYKRAAVAANYLSTCGVAKERLFVDTFGERFPDFSNKLAKTRDLNRRVDFLILPSNSLRAALSTN
ncbi:OmpA family protein [Lacihabitans sp. LS3-19]|uniref:OmpA family protein n=1 Tax=Lacihabitans sp. LS3-19 TaxID=2487335 RepID=UPI0020CCCE30|nr:OmpA family protein [Lacihabitans sp. LS3-19]MCP9768941.1 OmpA family protein [Lacihabitans sp. LS3-19]